MSKYTTDSKFGEVFDEPVFEGWQHMLDFRRDDSDDWLEKLTLPSVQAVYSCLTVVYIS